MQEREIISIFTNRSSQTLSRVVTALSENGALISICTKYPHRFASLKIIGYPGQIKMVKIIKDQQALLIDIIKKSNKVINMMFPGYYQKKHIAEVCYNFPEKIAKICYDYKVKLIHISSLISNTDAKNHLSYYKKGNVRVLEVNPKSTIINLPSLIIGEWNFLGLVGFALKNIGFAILPGNLSNSSIKLTTLSDISENIVRLIYDEKEGIYDIDSSSVTIVDLCHMFCEVNGFKKNRIIAIPRPISKLVIWLFTLVPFIRKSPILIDMMLLRYNEICHNKPILIQKKSSEIKNYIKIKTEHLKENAEMLKRRNDYGHDYYPHHN